MPQDGHSGGERGSAAIELALVLSLFCPLVLFGVSDLATVSYDSIEVASAAHVGALYGMRSSTYAENTSTIISVARNEAPDFGTNLTVTPTIFFACSSNITGTQYSTQTAANLACTGMGNHSLEFLKVFTTVTINAPFRIPPLATTYTITGTAVMEVQE